MTFAGVRKGTRAHPRSPRFLRLRGFAASLGMTAKDVTKGRRKRDLALGMTGVGMFSQGDPYTLHDLRHTFATFMIGSGADVRTAADYLGHANPSMTLDIYPDVDPEAKQQAVKYIEDAFDDSYSVFQRDVEQRRAEMERSNTGFDSKRIENITPEPFRFLLKNFGQCFLYWKRQVSQMHGTGAFCLSAMQSCRASGSNHREGFPA